MTILVLILFSSLSFSEELPCVIEYNLARAEVQALGIPLSPEAKTKEPISNKYNYERCIRFGILSARTASVAHKFHKSNSIDCYERIPKAREEAMFWQTETNIRWATACSANSDHTP